MRRAGRANSCRAQRFALTARTQDKENFILSMPVWYPLSVAAHVMCLGYVDREIGQ